MKNHDIVPTLVEQYMQDGEYIVSTTDPAGRITSANDVLLRFSGYSADDLIGRQHNILRHPDMPRAVFSLAWETITNGEGFLGYIKNLSKDGSFYWVFAHIFPLYDDEGALTGYKSIRRKPRADALPGVVALYAAMCRAEAEAGPRDAIAAGRAVLATVLAGKAQSYEEFVAAL
jgi:PAS domain S-box-containing protein